MLDMGPFNLVFLVFFMSVAASETQVSSYKPISDPLVKHLVHHLAEDVQQIKKDHKADITTLQNDMLALQTDLKQDILALQTKLSEVLQKLKPEKGPSGSCPARFTARHNSSCYHFVPEQVDWLAAYLECSTTGTKLVSIESQEENAYLRNYIKKTRYLTTGDFWISGTDLQEEGIWFWAGSGKFMTFSDWHPGQPGSGTSENFLLLHKPTGWDWHDAPRDWKRGYICELSL